MHRRQHWPWYITLWYSVQGIYGVPSCVVSKILWDPPPWKRQACVHTGILTHADLGARVCDLIKRRILAFFFFFWKQQTGGLLPNSRTCHLHGNAECRQSSALWLCVARVSALPGWLIFSIHSCWFTWSQDAAEGCFNPWPAEGRGSWDSPEACKPPCLLLTF